MNSVENMMAVMPESRQARPTFHFILNRLVLLAAVDLIQRDTG